MEERRLLIAVALSLLLLTAYQMLMPAPPPKPPAPTPPTTVVTAAAATTPTGSAPSSVPASPASPVPALADDAVRRAEITSRDVEIAFTNRGARVLGWRLLHYADGRGKPEEMVHTVTGLDVRPLDLATGDPALDEKLKNALFRPSSEQVRAETGPAELRFEFADGDVHAVKTLRLEPHGYAAQVSVSLSRGGRPLPCRVVWGPGVSNPTDEEKKVQGYVDAQAVTRVAGSVERRPADELAADWPVSGPEWAGIEARYFVALFVPQGGAGATLRGLTAASGQKPSAVVAEVDAGTGGQPTLLYVGPKDHALLDRAGHRLADVVDVGEWIGPIVLALASLLRRVNDHVGNYGWSIVVLTVVINLLMAPLRHYSIANGVKMAKLAPEMRVIQERYRKVPALDPKRQEMQKEMSELYARHGMSMGTQMMVGCLPLLITMPFLIAFYRVLSVSIELRGADWAWIPDLSQRDPWFLTPVLMGASMFVMQKMMPSTMDAAQQRVMLIMPVVLTAMFFAAPSGLNLYWLASNVCSIVQQGVTLKLLDSGTEKADKRKA
jgi:YidC/Oxa1 family membrane protein insertase